MPYHEPIPYAKLKRDYYEGASFKAQKMFKALDSMSTEEALHLVREFESLLERKLWEREGEFDA